MDAGKTGAYLAALRKARGMTQQEAADQLGVSNKTVSKWENGAGLPDITVLPALAELYGVTADDILAGETLRGRPAEAQGPARRRLLLLRLRTRFDLCFIGSLALGVLAAFRVAYVSLAAWPLSVGLLWIGYVLAVHPARYGDISLDAKIWENLYRKLLAASAVQWWALLRLVRLGRLEVDFAEMRYYDTMQAWKPLLFAVGLALLTAGAFYASRTLNVLGLGPAAATGLGVNVPRATAALTAVAVGASGLACAVGGGLTFVGLVCPHMARRLVGPNFRALVPATVLVGVVLMLLADIISRTLLAPNEIPVGIVAAVIGAPYFLYLLAKS